MVSIVGRCAFLLQRHAQQSNNAKAVQHQAQEKEIMLILARVGHRVSLGRPNLQASAPFAIALCSCFRPCFSSRGVFTGSREAEYSRHRLQPSHR